MTREFEPKKEKVKGGWRKLHDYKHNLYSSLNKIRVIKSKEMRLSGQVEHIVQNRNASEHINLDFSNLRDYKYLFSSLDLVHSPKCRFQLQKPTAILVYDLNKFIYYTNINKQWRQKEFFFLD